MTQSTVMSRARPRLRRGPALGVCLLARLAGAPAGGPAGALPGGPVGAAGVNVEVRGVDDTLRANVLAYLSFERYKKGGVDLNADTVERLHNRVEREGPGALGPDRHRSGQERVARGDRHQAGTAGAGHEHRGEGDRLGRDRSALPAHRRAS